MEEQLKAEYQSMLNRWRSGALYFHFLNFIKRFAKRGWIRRGHIHQYVSAVLALARLGMPIRTPIVAYLADVSINSAYSGLLYLSSYNVLVPEKLADGTRVRTFKVSPEFIKHVYKKLSEVS